MIYFRLYVPSLLKVSQVVLWLFSFATWQSDWIGPCLGHWQFVLSQIAAALIN